MQQRVGRSMRRRGAFLSLAGATAFVAIGAGVLVTVIDPNDFHNVGDGLWWSIQTLSTVGYGDIVPHSKWGRLLGSGVIIFGVTFLAFLTALVTSMFVAAAQEEGDAGRAAERAADEAETRAKIDEVLKRLDAMEKRLSGEIDAAERDE
jgi:voltage-gated potassium channel